jgi:transposase
MIEEARKAEILRLFFAEKWRVGTIAQQLGLHHGTVQRVIDASSRVDVSAPTRPTLADPYIPFIEETLEKFPTLPASRLWQMVRERGYPGACDHFRTVVARYRPRKKPEAYLRLRTLPGEQAQVDWGHFGTITIGRAVRKLMAFVMVLSWSRQVFLRFYLNAAMPSFLRGHVEAFEFFGGVPRVALYDNLKSAVLERRGDAIRFHPALLELAAHYRYEPRPVALARGNEKGRVERAIRYIRSSFFIAREYQDIDDLNDQALVWCRGSSAERKNPDDETLTVGEAFEQERPRLLSLPGNAFPADERISASVGKTPYVRFDLNDYSVRSDHVRKTVTVVASLERVRILDGTDVVGDHERCWDRRQTIEDPTHVKELVEWKAQARQHRGLDRLHHAVPSSRELFRRLAESGASLGGSTASLLKQLDLVGAVELEAAVSEAIENDAPHLHGVHQVLERRRHKRGAPPPVGGHLARDPRVQGHVVRHHDLTDYDKLGQSNHEKNDNSNEKDTDDGKAKK